VSPTLVEEESQAPTMVGMEIDLHDSAQGHQTNDTGNIHQYARAKESQSTNGYATKKTEATTPRPKPKTRSVQQQEELVEHITGKPSLGAEDRQAEVGTSNTLVRRKGKHPMAQSSCNNHTITHPRGSSVPSNTFGLHGISKVFKP
jgi:hypothetical protein